MDSIGAYLNAIGKIPLLTAEEEIILGRAVQTGLAIESEIPPSERSKPQRRSVAAGRRAKKRMIECNLRLVVNVAKKYQRFGLDFMDLVQEGALGLNRAVEKFDPERGYKFSTYSYWWIRQSMTRALETYARTIRLPVHLNEIHSKIKRFTRSFLQDHNRQPTLQELADHCEITAERVKEVLQAYAPIASLDASVNDDCNSSMIDIIGDSGAERPMEAVASLEEADTLASISCVLSEKEYLILSHRYGFATGKRLTLKETAVLIADSTDERVISRERVRQLETRALNKLRRAAGVLGHEPEQLNLAIA